MAAAKVLGKSLHFTNAWHAKSGGIRTFYRALLRAAERRRHLLRLVVPGERDVAEDVGECGRIYYVKSDPAPLDREYRMIGPRSYLLSGARIPAILSAERPELVEVNDKYTLMYLAGMLRERMVGGVSWRPTTVGLSCERMDQNMRYYLLGKSGQAAATGARTGSPFGALRESLAGTFARVYMKWLYFPMFDHHITVSEHTAAELCVAGRGHKVRRGVWVMPMGVELDCFSPSRRGGLARQWLSNLVYSCGASCLTGNAPAPPRETPFYLLYVGRLAPEKNLGLLLDLISRLKDSPVRSFHLLIAGGGPLRNWFEERSRELAPGRVHFFGHIDDRTRLADIYANADAFVHPNPDEPFGIALLEAMASGLPLVAPNRGGVTQYVGLENAWSVEPTAQAFEAAVHEIAAEPAQAAYRVKLALETAGRYGWDAVADSFLELYAAIHRVQIGADERPATPPLFYSTPGDYWGRERPATRRRGENLASG